MQFTLTIGTNNAAFADEETGEVDAYSASREVARILCTVAEQVAAGDLVDEVGHSIRDENGNEVGSFDLA